MKHLVAVALLVLIVPAASAQATRTWVSGVGDDANPCSRTAPCKTFAGAISKTAAGGEINALDDGGFGGVTIGKAITIDGGGHLASILASGTNGVTINAGSNDVVTLRRLQINGASGSGLDGVRVLAGRQINIEDVEIFGFSGDGVEVGSAMTSGNVRIAGSTIANNAIGVNALAGNVAITTSNLAGNSATGVDANGSTAFVLVSNCELTMNGRGVRSQNSATARISHNDIMFNSVAPWEILSGGKIETHVDNRTRGTGIGALTTVSYP